MGDRKAAGLSLVDTEKAAAAGIGAARGSLSPYFYLLFAFRAPLSVRSCFEYRSSEALTG